MDTDRILASLNSAEVDYILIGGMNFLLRHKPELTFDIDVWVRDDAPNLARLNTALLELKAAWGPDDQTWEPVPAYPAWLRRQSVFCLTTAAGALDVFRHVAGLGDFETSKNEASLLKTAAGVPFLSLSDADMIRCQEALPEAVRKTSRLHYLRSLNKDDNS